MADNPNVKVTADTSQATQALNALANTMNNFSKSMKNVAKSFGTTGQMIQDIGDNMYSAGSKITAGISLPLAALGKKMIESGANLQAFEATYKQSFKGLASSATKWAGTTAKAIGYTDTQVRQQLLSFNQYGKAMGMTGTTALDFSKKMVTLTDDLAAFYDVDPTEATNRMKSALMGNFEAVDKLGLAFEESTIKAEMMKEGLKGQYADLDSTQKMWVLYNLAVKQSADAVGQAARESDQFQAQMQNIKGQLQELAYKVFAVLQPEIQDILDKIKDLITKLQKLSPEQIKTLAHIAEFLIVAPFILMYLGIIISSVGRLIKGMKDIAGAISWLTDFKKRSEEISKTWNKLAGFFTKTLPKMGKGIGGFFVQIATKLGIVGIAILGLVIIIGLAAYEIYKHWNEIKKHTADVWDNIKQYLADTWQGIKDNASSIWSGIVGFFSSIWQGIKNVFSTIGQVISPIIDEFAREFGLIGQVIGSIAGEFAREFGLIGQAFSYLWNDIIAPIGQFIGGFFQALGELVVWVFQQVISGAIDWVSQKWNWLYSSVISPIGEAIKNVITTIGQFFISLYTNYVQPAINYIQQLWAGLCQAFQSFYQAYIVPVIQAFIAAWNSVKNAFNSVMQFMKGIWQGFVTGIQSIWNAIGVPFINKVKSIWNTVKGAWSSALSGIKNIWSNFIGGLKNAWDRFKAWFKLPHLRVVGSWDLTPPDISMPHFAVDWYKKGGLFPSNNPSLIGVGEGSDDEAVVPLNNNVFNKLGAGIARHIPDDTNNGNTVNNYFELNGWIVREEADVTKIAKKLKDLQEQADRAKGGLSYIG